MNKLNSLKWCSNCLAMSTRPRISFDKRGWCNACTWTKEKKLIDWKSRHKELEVLLAKHRRYDGFFDVLVPVSGGKDGSYVAHTLKHKYGLNPLTVTVSPPIPLALGEENLKSFINSGYNHISINTCPKAMRELNKIGFIEMGFPYYGWLTAIQTAVIRMSLQFGISLIFYGEDGEVEYGGTTETSKSPFYSIEYMKRVYLEGGYDKVLKKSLLNENDLFFFKFPDDYQLKKCPVELVHWSYFENWDPYRNYIVAKENCGLKENKSTNEGTFTNFSQNDQHLYALHTYLMYLKFGFGRANQDACIEIRRGAMDRKQALNLVRLYDGIYPSQFIDIYLNYYGLTRYEFEDILDFWANKDLFQKEDGLWKPKFSII